MPAFWALIRGRIILSARTRRSRMPTKEKMLTFTPAEIAEIQSPKGTKLKKITTTTKISIMGTTNARISNPILIHPLFPFLTLTLCHCHGFSLYLCHTHTLSTVNEIPIGTYIHHFPLEISYPKGPQCCLCHTFCPQQAL